MNPSELVAHWMHRVNSADKQGLCDLYSERAVLIPTFSNRMLGTPAGIADYFERLCARPNLSITLHERTLAVQAATPALHVLSGLYCWRFEVDGEMLAFEARFTYVVDLDAARPILHHHSSQIPRML